MSVTFTVPGVPVPQGSMSVFNGRVVHKSGKTLIKWRERIERSARAAGAPLLTGPVRVEVLFLVPRPKSVRRLLPSVRPDADKYLRACLDALTGTCFVDDGQVVDVLVRKRYALHGPLVGARITVSPVAEILEAAAA